MGSLLDSPIMAVRDGSTNSVGDATEGGIRRWLPLVAIVIMGDRKTRLTLDRALEMLRGFPQDSRTAAKKLDLPSPRLSMLRAPPAAPSTLLCLQPVQGLIKNDVHGETSNPGSSVRLSFEAKTRRLTCPGAPSDSFHSSIPAHEGEALLRNVLRYEQVMVSSQP